MRHFSDHRAQQDHFVYMALPAHLYNLRGEAAPMIVRFLSKQQDDIALSCLVACSVGAMRIEPIRWPGKTADGAVGNTHLRAGRREIVELIRLDLCESRCLP